MGKSYSKGSVSVECDIEVLLERLTHCDRIGMTVQANPDGTSWDESETPICLQSQLYKDEDADKEAHCHPDCDAVDLPYRASQLQPLS